MAMLDLDLHCELLKEAIMSARVDAPKFYSRVDETRDKPWQIIQHKDNSVCEPVVVAEYETYHEQCVGMLGRHAAAEADMVIAELKRALRDSGDSAPANVADAA